MIYKDKICDVCGVVFTPRAPNQLRCGKTCAMVVILNNMKREYHQNPTIKCMRAKKYYKKNATQVIAYNRKYNEANIDHIKERTHKYYRSRNTLNFLGKTVEMSRHTIAPCGYCWHHTCYDHSDPEANIVLITSSSHTMGHNLLRKLGIEIPHINIKEKK